MKYHQTYYTSSTVGLRGGKGFQINAASPGIESAILEHVERLGVYVPPLSQPTRPTTDELTQFPVSLQFHRLPDGRALLGRAKYTGTDYTGRFGNYFSHSLITTDAHADSGRFLPVELWGSSTWVTRESSVTTLPMADEPEVGCSINPARVQQFLFERGRMSHVGAAITAAEEALRHRRRLILIDENESIALWIAAISYALPRHLAWQLTFNTYVKNPYQTDALVTGTTPDSDFGFTPYEIEHQYSVFDFVNNRFTTFAPTSFAKSITKAYATGRGAEVAEFGRFTEQAAPDLVIEELEVAFAWHALSCSLGEQEISRAELLRWCARRVRRVKPEIIRTSLRGLIPDDIKDFDLIAAFTTLYRATLAPEIDTAVRSMVELRYIEWLIRSADSMDLQLLSRAVETFERSDIAPQSVAPLRVIWFEQVRRVENPARLCLLLSMGDRAGLLSEAGEVVRRASEKIIGPSLVDPGVQQAVVRLLDRPVASEVLAGVAIYLDACSAKPETIRALRGFLHRPQVITALDDNARRNGLVGLHFRLVAEKSTRPIGARHETLRECIEDANSLGAEMTTGRLEIAFDAIWRGSLPTVREAIGLLGMVEPVLLAQTSIPGQLANALAHGADLRRDDPDRAELLQKLKCDLLNAALDHKKYLLEAWDIASRVRSSSMDDAVPALRDGLSYASRLAEPLRSSLLDLMSECLLRVRDPELHEDLLCLIAQEYGNAFLCNYADRVQDMLTAHPRPELVAQLFFIWTKAGPALGPGKNPLNSVLLKSLKKWRQPDFQKVSALLDDPSVRGSWEEQTSGLSIRRLDRFARWLGFEDDTSN